MINPTFLRHAMAAFFCLSSAFLFAQSPVDSISASEFRNYKQLLDVLAIRIDTTQYKIHSFQVNCEAGKKDVFGIRNQGNFFGVELQNIMRAAQNGDSYAFTDVKVVRNSDKKVRSLSEYKKIYIASNQIVAPANNTAAWQSLYDVFPEIPYNADLLATMYLTFGDNEPIEVKTTYQFSTLIKEGLGRLRAGDYLVIVVHKPGDERSKAFSIQ